MKRNAANTMKVRDWWVSAKPLNVPADGFKYIDRDGPFATATAAAEFVEANRPVTTHYMVSIYSKVRVIKIK